MTIMTSTKQRHCISHYTMQHIPAKDITQSSAYHGHTHIYIHTYIHTYTHTYIHTYIHTHIRAHTLSLTHTLTHAQRRSLSVQPVHPEALGLLGEVYGPFHFSLHHYYLETICSFFTLLYFTLLDFTTIY